jgi:hypothetical protein
MHYQRDNVIRFKDTGLYIIKESKGKVLVLPRGMYLVKEVYILSMDHTKNEIYIVSDDYTFMTRICIGLEEHVDIIEVYDWLYENLLTKKTPELGNV